jgi:glycosyltransferase involved in cell wall biosynthesis
MFRPLPGDRRAVFGERISESDIVLLYAGRLSEEKGVFDLPGIMASLDRSGVNIRLVIAGTGPAQDRLKALLPEALFLGWVERSDMPALYSRTDLLVLPSRFDTFGNVILEAMSCGAAVAAYAEKGPLEIIQTRENGILAEDPAGLANSIVRFARDETFRHALKKNSLIRANAFSREVIFEAFLTDLGLTDHLSAPLSKTETMKAAIGY